MTGKLRLAVMMHAAQVIIVVILGVYSGFNSSLPLKQLSAPMEDQRTASDGTRSRTGCLTCRIRKKKCDEQRPVCDACRGRQIACYGFATPIPSWISNKASWKEVRDSNEAKTLRTLAELRYRVSRKVEAQASAPTVAALSEQNPDVDPSSMYKSEGPLKLDRGLALRDKLMTPSMLRLTAGVNIWQMHPETIWWDSKIQNLRPESSGYPSSSSFNPSSSHEETRLLMLFLEVIHPITHTFYKLDKLPDRNWMLTRLLETESVYCSALSISACFENSLTQKPSINEIGISPKVTKLQSQSIAKLRYEVDQFALMQTTPLEEFICAGVRLLDAIGHLETLEIFSMLQGQWEMHHQASRRILHHIETKVREDKRSSSTSIIATMLTTLPEHDSRRRSLEFCLLNYIWIDVLAASTFGAALYCPCDFDYLPLLDTKIIKPQEIMGCQGWILAVVYRIAKLEQWKATHHNERHLPRVQAELLFQRNQLENELDEGIAVLQKQADKILPQQFIGPYTTPTHQCSQPRTGHDPMRGVAYEPNSVAAALDHDSILISIIWAYGAKVLLQVTTAHILPGQVCIDQTFVNICLEKLEALPARLVMRTTWPYTIAGSMAFSAAQHDRFRWIVGKTLHEAQAPGVSWKGLIVMEECWRLRRTQDDQFIGWREAMDSLGAKVILT